MKKWIAFLLVLSMIIPSTAFANQKPINEKLGVPIVVYGSNLSDDEKSTVKQALRVENEQEID